MPRSGRGAPGPGCDCGDRARPARAEDCAGPVFRRLIFAAGLASVPTALADLDVVRGTARSATLALALVIVVTGVASLYLPRPVSLRGRPTARVSLVEAAQETLPTSAPSAAIEGAEGPGVPSAPSPEPPSPVSGRGRGL